MILSLSLPGDADTIIASAPPLPDVDETPGFHAKTLPSNYRYNTGSSTLYLFPNDTAFNSMFEKYHGSLVLLIRNCSGTNGTMIMWEGTATPPAKTIDRFYYHGQQLVALTSWYSASYDKAGTMTNESWGWMQNATMDWRANIWNPTKGIGFTRVSTQTLGQTAELVLFYFVPDPVTPSPVLIGGGGGGRKCKL